MMKQKDIAKNLKISETVVSRLFSGERKISWSIAERLAKIFPGRSVSEWKRSNPEELKRVFNILSETKNLMENL